MVSEDTIKRAPKYEKADPEDMAELQEAIESLRRDGHSFKVIETSFEDSRRYFCLITQFSWFNCNCHLYFQEDKKND